jgi:hypothetical protein
VDVAYAGLRVDCRHGLLDSGGGSKRCGWLNVDHCWRIQGSTFHGRLSSSKLLFGGDRCSGMLVISC